MGPWISNGKLLFLVRIAGAFRVCLTHPVFLRALEYYSGIMFLTTNRVRSFDLAALDRMTLIVQYEYPGPQVKERIRGFCIRKLTESGHFDLDAGARSEYCKIDTAEEYHWSGREIVSGECNHEIGMIGTDPL